MILDSISLLNLDANLEREKKAGFLSWLPNWLRLLFWPLIRYTGSIKNIIIIFTLEKKIKVFFFSYLWLYSVCNSHMLQAQDKKQLEHNTRQRWCLSSSAFTIRKDPYWCIFLSTPQLVLFTIWGPTFTFPSKIFLLLLLSPCYRVINPSHISWPGETFKIPINLLSRAT